MGNKTLARLRDANLGEVLQIGCIRIAVARTESGCLRCYFSDGKGARHCAFAASCMSHCRPDGKSVIFKEKQV